MDNTRHKELTAHIRKRIKEAGIPARVKMNQSCGTKYITVVCPSYDAHFSIQDQRQIRLIAKTNRMTWVRGMEIDVYQDTDPMQMDFYI